MNRLKIGDKVKLKAYVDLVESHGDLTASSLTIIIGTGEYIVAYVDGRRGVKVESDSPSINKALWSDEIFTKVEDRPKIFNRDKFKRLLEDL